MRCSHALVGSDR